MPVALTYLTMELATTPARRTLIRRAIALQSAIIAYNVAEGVISVIAGLLAGSVVLVGFGLDSAIEVSAAIVVLFHLSRSGDEVQPHWESRVAGFVGVTLLLVAAYVAGRSIYALATESRPSESLLGIAITAASLVIMPLVSMLQRRYALKINSGALLADSRETLVCTYLSAAALLGLTANAAFGWWWADPAAGLVLVYFISREGWEIYRNRELLCVD
jgi:divalent metal cation (Fe/Co/Zn/Cd) transporter